MHTGLTQNTSLSVPHSFWQFHISLDKLANNKIPQMQAGGAEDFKKKSLYGLSETYYIGHPQTYCPRQVVSNTGHTKALCNQDFLPVGNPPS